MTKLIRLIPFLVLTVNIAAGEKPYKPLMYVKISSAEKVLAMIELFDKKIDGNSRQSAIEFLKRKFSYSTLRQILDMNRSLMETDAVTKTPEIVTELEEVVKTPNGKGNLPSLNIQLFRAAKKVAEIRCFSVGMQVLAPAAQKCAYIAQLGVAETEQSKGLGAYLLRKSLHELKKCGYENAILNTRFDNYRSQLLYSNQGFQVVDLTYSYYNFMPP